MASRIKLKDFFESHGITVDHRTAMLGNILVDGVRETSMHALLKPKSKIIIRNYYKKYVSRGGIKLEHALKTFSAPITDKTVIDCGASSGGFTDCALQHGAKAVYAVEAGNGQLALRLQNDKRVINLENTNISDMVKYNYVVRPNYATVDIGYLSLKKAVPIFQSILYDDFHMIALLKPIYETENLEKRRSGMPLSGDELCDVICDVLGFIVSQPGLYVGDITYSPILGNNGQIEFFYHITDNREMQNDLECKVKTVVEQALSISDNQSYHLFLEV